MKRCLVAMGGVFISALLSAQVYVANDSVLTGNQSVNMIFYNLQTGAKTVRDNTNWHLAITARPTQFPGSPLGGTTIRVNEALGVKAIYVPNAKAADFGTLDTTGYMNWSVQHDSDSLMDLGALNQNRNTGNVFDFGWGVYNSASHHVVGDSLYLIKLPNGNLKKLLVEKLFFDTTFVIRYSNIDNSDLQIISIPKKQYPGKNFVYLNMYTHLIEDKEPLSSDWDIQFLKYTATDVPGSSFKTVFGTLQNSGVSTAKVKGSESFGTDYLNHSFSPALNAIGWDWKSVQYGNNLTFKDIDPVNSDVYKIEDSLAYFITTRTGETFKLVFTQYTTSTNGKLKFYVQNLSQSTSITEYPELLSPPSLFPNPTSGLLNIVYSSELPDYFEVYNIYGQVIFSQRVSGQVNSISTADFQNGLYFVSSMKNGKSTLAKFIVAH